MRVVSALRAGHIPLFLALLAIPVSDVAGGPPASDDPDELKFAQMIRSFTESMRTVVAGEPKRAALHAGEAAIGYWWPTIGERAPEWAKRFEFELDVQHDDKPTWSVLTVQPLFQSEDKQNTVFTQLRIARDFTFGSHRTTTNAGLGYRRLVWDDRVLLGVNAFFDHEFDNDHNRAGGGLDAESFTIRPETRFNLPRGAIFGYHRAQFEEASGECRLIRLQYRLWRDKLEQTRMTAYRKGA